MSATRPVVGASDHYGWAELITLAERDAAPVLLDRRRVELIDARLPSAPYHHEALELPLEAAIELVDRVRRSVAERASTALSSLLESHRVGALILPASPFERLPDSLAEVLGSRRMTVAADGMLYREALADAATRSGLKVSRYSRKSDPTALAADALGIDGSEISALVAELGRRAGPPWRKDHKLAAAAALILLGPRLRR